MDAPVFVRDSGGPGTPVLLLHGIGASSRIFDDVVQRGAPRFRFLVPDLPGAGKSGRYARLDPRVLAAHLHEHCQSNGVEPAFIVGHSFGGLVTLELLRTSSGSVRGVVLASVPALGAWGLRVLLGLPAADWLMHAAGRLPPSALWVRTYLPRIWGSAASIEERHIQSYVEAMGAQDFFPSMLEALRHLTRYQLDAPALLTPRVPVSLLWGDEDRLVSVRDGRKLAEQLQVPLRVLPGVGHCLPEEAPEAIVEALDVLAAGGAQSET